MRLSLVAVLIAALAVAAGAGAKPRQPPPKAGGPRWPPPAWIEIPGRSAWLAYASFCWRARCVDFAPPATRTDVPAVRARRGDLARVHLGFRPRQVTVTTLEGGRWGAPVLLAPGPVAEWAVERAGIVQVSAFAADGVASYLVRLDLR